MTTTAFAETPFPARKRFRRNEYHFLADSGMLEADKRYELLDGDILEQMPQKEPHGTLTMRWLFALAAVFGQAFVRCQMPIVLSDDSEPEPDVAVTARPADDYLKSDNPPAHDVRLVIEIALSSLDFDTRTKATRYARSGIPECWVLDVIGRRLLLFRDPSPDGYQTRLDCDANGSVSPLAAPAVVFAVKDFLP